METQNIAVVVLLLVLTGMLIGIGTLTLDKFGRATRTTTTVVDTNNNLSVTGTVDFSTEYCIEVKQIDNTSTTFELTTYNVTFSDADGCVMSYSGIAACDATPCNITYTYGADSTAATTTASVTSAITPLASTWLPLVVTVVVLSIILSLVITSFARRRE